MIDECCISSVGGHLLLWLNFVCCCLVAAVILLLRLQNVERASCDASLQTSDGVLELAVLGGVDERIDTAVDQHQHHGEVVERLEKSKEAEN